MKASQRLDYTNLAAALEQRNLVDRPRLNLALKTSHQGTTPFPELLVLEGALGDWELSRVVSDLYSLPFLPVDLYSPNPKAMEGLDAEFLREHRLIPLDRHGQVLTVCMPALVPAEVLGQLAAECDCTVIPVVGSVESNNRWLANNLAREVEAALPSETPTHDATWSNLFDAGDAAVMQDLTPGANPGSLPLDLPPLPGETPSA